MSSPSRSPSAPTAAERRSLALVGAAFLAWAAAFVWRSSFVALDGRRIFCLFDDSMISMRYAWNLAHGNGLVWNPGERVEGITNLLWALVMAIPAGLLSKSAAVLAIQILGVGLMLATARLTVAIADRLRLREGAPGGGPAGSRALTGAPRTAVFGAALAIYPLAFWTLMGMETGLLALLLAAAVLVAFGRRGARRPLPALPILLGLAYLTRPDAAIAAALVMLYRWLGLARALGGRRGMVAAIPTLAVESGLLAAFPAGATLFRRLYYGSAVPNTYLLKMTGIPVGERLADGLEFVAPFLLAAAPALALAAVGVAVRRDLESGLLTTLFLATVAYQVWVGGDAWPYWRMMAPVLPALFVVSALGARRLAAALPWAGSRPAAAAAIAVTLLAGSVWSLDHRFRGELLLAEPAYFVEYNRRNVNTAIVLEEVLEPGATIGVTWGGTIPYYTPFKAIDFLGKSDPYIASLPGDSEGQVAYPGHNKYDLEHSILERRPTYVQVTKWGRQNVGQAAARFYQPVRYRGVALILDRDSPLVRWDAIRAWLREQRRRDG